MSLTSKIICGFPFGVGLMIWHSLTLGIDYTIWVSTAPAVFADILNHSGTYALGINESGLANLTKESAAAFSVAQSIWAGGQLLGCMASAPLPKVFGYRFAFIFMLALSMAGNVMYSVGGIVGGVGGLWIAWLGRALDGFGDGSVALGLGYIPVVLFNDRKKADAAMIHYRSLMGFGSFVGACIALGLQYVHIDEPRGADGVTRVFSGGDLVGWAMTAIYCPSLFVACCALDNSKPPTQGGKAGGKGAACTPYFTRKSCFWLFLVFSYGLTGSLATYFLPVFPYCPGYCNELASLATISLGSYITYTTIGAFGAGAIGAFFNSAFSMIKSCKVSGLAMLQVAATLITISMGLMYSGYRIFDTNADEVGLGQYLFMVGVCLYFFASTSLSAGMAPVFKEIIPKTSLSAMMPLYKMCLDSGKVVGPPYSDWASTTSSSSWKTRADVAFIPSIVIYVLITLALYFLGKYLSTPDFVVAKPDDRGVSLLKPDGPSKTAEMTHYVGSARDMGGRAPSTKATSDGYELYGGSSLSRSQLADVKNIDKVKVSLVI